MDRNQLLNDPETAQRISLDGRQAQIWTTMPGIVESVDLTAMTCEVQPAVQGTQTNGDGSTQYVNLPLLVDCPLIFPSGGGFTLTFPVEEGDEVLIHIASRCINTWWQNGGVGVPEEFRMHDLSDGFAQCGPRSQPNVIPSISSNSTQLRNESGTIFLEITETGVNIKGTVTVIGDVIADGVSLINHVHGGVANGPGDTGPPI